MSAVWLRFLWTSVPFPVVWLVVMLGWTWRMMYGPGTADVAAPRRDAEFRLAAAYTVWFTFPVWLIHLAVLRAGVRLWGSLRGQALAALSAASALLAVAALWGFAAWAREGERLGRHARPLGELAIFATPALATLAITGLAALAARRAGSGARAA